MAEQDGERVNANFRNGTLTTCGVLVGFSLGFLSQWSLMSGSWHAIDVAAAGVIAVGIALQMNALRLLFHVDSLLRANYERSVRHFLAGLYLAGLGVALALFVSLLGLGPQLIPAGDAAGRAPGAAVAAAA
jgi:hypothetical protein